VDTTGLRAAIQSFLVTARSGRFGPAPSSEWNAEQLPAHIVTGDTAITSVALAIAAGQRPSYDNRPSLDPWNLARICAAAGDLSSLIDLVDPGSTLVPGRRTAHRRRGQRARSHADHLQRRGGAGRLLAAA
jgi:hypothetical protein